jgi:hypothetical protein
VIRSSREFFLNADFHVTFRDHFTCRKSTTWDRRFYFPCEGRRAGDFFALKNPTASAGFEPANLGTRGQYASSRPPKSLARILISRYSYVHYFFSQEAFSQIVLIKETLYSNCACQQQVYVSSVLVFVIFCICCLLNILISKFSE